MANKSEDGFHEAMIGIYHAAATLGYRAPYFLRMVQERGGLGAAKHLLSGPDPQSGFTRLWELRRLDLSMEALVLEERWSGLFTEDECRTARARLEAYGYAARSPHAE